MAFSVECIHNFMLHYIFTLASSSSVAPCSTHSQYWPFHTDLDVIRTPCSKVTQANPSGRPEEFICYEMEAHCQDFIHRFCPDCCSAGMDCSGGVEDAFWLQITIMIHFESYTYLQLPAGKTIIAMTWVLRRVEIWYFSRSGFFPLFCIPLCESIHTSTQG